MMDPFDVDSKVYRTKVIRGCIAALLSSYEDLRDSAEKQLKILEVFTHFGIDLTKTMFDPNEPVSIKKLASVLLCRYVKLHWSEDMDGYQCPEIPFEDKIKIRKLLMKGLQVPETLIRLNIARILGQIYGSDCQSNWEELVIPLLQSSMSHEKDIVQGSLEALSEIASNSSDGYVSRFVKEALPTILNILMNKSSYTVDMIRVSFIIFEKCLIRISETDQKENVIGFLDVQLIPELISSCQIYLKTSVGSSDYCLKIYAISVLKWLLILYPSQNWVKETLALMASTLEERSTEILDMFIRAYKTLFSGNYEGGENAEICSLLSIIYEFISLVIEKVEEKEVLRAFTPFVNRFIIPFITITQDEDDVTSFKKNLWNASSSAKPILLDLSLFHDSDDMGNEFLEEYNPILKLNDRIENNFNYLVGADNDRGLPISDFHTWCVNATVDLDMNDLKEIYNDYFKTSTNVRYQYIIRDDFGPFLPYVAKAAKLELVELKEKLAEDLK